MFKRILKYLNDGNARTRQIKKNIAASFFLKGINVVISFLLVSVTLNYLNPMKYGIWLTLSSILGWVYFFDLGLGNGLRNKFAEAVANNDRELARKYISTTYVVVFIITIIFYLFFLVINPLLDWSFILNTGHELRIELSVLACIVFTFFILRFIFGLINVILIADQKPALSDAINVLSNFFILLIVYILTKISTAGSLLLLGSILSVIPVIVLVAFSVFFYWGKYKDYRPSIKYVDMKHFYELGSLGIQFFIIQMAVLVVFQTNNIIIAQMFGPAEVTPYNIAYKYFLIATLIFNIIITPFWSAYTEAYIRNDFIWIKRITNKLIRIWGVIVALVILMVIFSNIFYKIWIGNLVRIPILLTIFMGVFVLISAWNNIFVFFINGIGKIRIQLYCGVIIALINVPMAIFFAKNLS
ncbi:MAG: MATE family efflux transporter, partial [Actinobacteria bacterium]|nr:MATE family efflux transporter [Actinomycetota bacterium]